MRAAWPFAAFSDIPCETRWSLIASYCRGKKLPPIDRVIIAPPELRQVRVVASLDQRVGARWVVSGVRYERHVSQSTRLGFARPYETPLQAVASVPGQDANTVEVADVVVAVALLESGEADCLFAAPREPPPADLGLALRCFVAEAGVVERFEFFGFVVAINLPDLIVHPAPPWTWWGSSQTAAWSAPCSLSS